MSRGLILCTVGLLFGLIWFALPGEGEFHTLKVLTLNSPTTYYETLDNQFAGLDYDLTQAFGRYLQLPVSYQVYPNVSKLLQALERGEGHLAAAGLTLSEGRVDRFEMSTPYQEITEQIVCRKGLKRPGVILVPKDTHYVTSLKEKMPDGSWFVNDSLTSEQIFPMVARGEVDCTVADSHIVSVHRRTHPDLKIVQSLGERKRLGWFFRKGDKRLKNWANDWLGWMEEEGKLTYFIYRNYAFLGQFDYYDLKHFQRLSKNLLPKYEPLFKKVGKEYGIPWRFLAAMAYQESRWDPLAKSPTGVRGMMMLTLPTAKSVGVDNRLEAAQSIWGGAVFFRKLFKRIPAEVTGQDRWWLALAAYNVGYGHLTDAMKLARSENRNPYLWSSLVDVLPLLSKKEIYKSLKHGYARGWEPVQYVQRVRNYYDLLRRGPQTWVE